MSSGSKSIISGLYLGADKTALGWPSAEVQARQMAKLNLAQIQSDLQNSFCRIQFGHESLAVSPGVPAQIRPKLRKFMESKGLNDSSCSRSNWPSELE